MLSFAVIGKGLCCLSVDKVLGAGGRRYSIRSERRAVEVVMKSKKPLGLGRSGFRVSEVACLGSGLQAVTHICQHASPVLDFAANEICVNRV